MNRDELQDEIRVALRRRAEQLPVRPAPPVLRPSRGDRNHRMLLAGAIAVLALTIGVLAVANGEPPSRVAAGDPTPPRHQGNHLTFDLPGFRYQRVEEICGPASQGPGGHRLDSFGTSYYESPILFVQTIPDFGPDSAFGLLDEGRGDPVTLRGVAGWALPQRGADRGWFMNAILPDGDAIFVTVLGMDTDAAVAMVDRLERSTDGGWLLPPTPDGFQRLEPTRAQPGCGYSAAGEGFEVNVYVDAFDSRLQDRVSSTVGATEPLDLAGIPGVIGDYAADDHWVMAEPAPGLTLEIRASGMTRAEVLELVGRARFVDEAGWRAVQPSGDERGPSGTATVRSGAQTATTSTTIVSAVTETTAAP